MKLTIIARGETWHTKQLMEEGKRKGVEVEVVNIKTLNGIAKRIEELGEVVLWRSSSLPMPLSRSVFIKAAAAKRQFFNDVIGDNPLVPYKFFQQKLVNPLRTITGIPSYEFRSEKGLAAAIEKGLVKFPFVAKKNLSARGEGVYKISSLEQVRELKLNFREYIFQNYVKNDGDFRILVLGGVALGIIKRVKGKDEFRNNISLGGTAFDMKDLPEAEDLKNKAVSLASKFGLKFCGVDFIYDQDESIYRFMEINSVPQWQGFSAATGVNVGEKVIEYSICLAERETKKPAELVRGFYRCFSEFLPRPTEFHLWSRMWLFNKDEESRKKLDELASWYLGKDEGGFEKRIADLTRSTAHKDDPQTERKATYQRYPKLLKYGSLLFWWLMARDIYGVDYRSEIERVASDEDLLSLAERLYADIEAVKILSSGATNFFYLLEAYLGKKVETDRLFELVKDEEYHSDRENIKRVFYFLSHLVIGETQFYTRMALDNEPVVKRIVIKLEEIVRRDYFKVSLDMKFEFLVCCRIAGYKTDLFDMIMGEAERSLSSSGNFLIDTHNAWIHGFGNKFSQAEHRNALYLMISERS